MYVIGIDGGGTKTKAVIANENGEIFAEAKVGASNPNSVAEADLRIELGKLFRDLQMENREAFSQVQRVVAGMSGVDHPEARKNMERLLIEVLPENMPVTVTNDAITALYSGTLGKPGIVQIAGTGSITYGLNEVGELDRVGGWGYLLGEQGSGYALGADTLHDAFLSHDGLGEKTVLNELLLEHFQVEALPDMIQTVYHAKNPKELIASLSRITMKAVVQGDAVAQRIISKNAAYIGDSIACLMKKMFPQDTEIPVVLVGGLFNRYDLFEEIFQEIIKKKGFSARMILPKIEPVGGAVIVGLKEESVMLGDEFERNFSR